MFSSLNRFSPQPFHCLTVHRSTVSPIFRFNILNRSHPQPFHRSTFPPFNSSTFQQVQPSQLFIPWSIPLFNCSIVQLFHRSSGSTTSSFHILNRSTVPPFNCSTVQLFQSSKGSTDRSFHCSTVPPMNRLTSSTVHPINCSTVKLFYRSTVQLFYSSNAPSLNSFNPLTVLQLHLFNR